MEGSGTTEPTSVKVKSGPPPTDGTKAKSAVLMVVVFVPLLYVNVGVENAEFQDRSV